VKHFLITPALSWARPPPPPPRPSRARARRPLSQVCRAPAPRPPPGGAPSPLARPGAHEVHSPAPDATAPRHGTPLRAIRASLSKLQTSGCWPEPAAAPVARAHARSAHHRHTAGPVTAQAACAARLSQRPRETPSEHSRGEPGSATAPSDPTAAHQGGSPCSPRVHSVPGPPASPPPLLFTPVPQPAGARGAPVAARLPFAVSQNPTCVPQPLPLGPWSRGQPRLHHVALDPTRKNSNLIRPGPALPHPASAPSSRVPTGIGQSPAHQTLLTPYPYSGSSGPSLGWILEP
jgi:hypothetical protein